VAGQLGPLPLAQSAPARAAAPTAVTPHPPPARPPAVTHPRCTLRLHQWPGRPPRAGHCAAAQRSQSRSYVLAALRALHLDSDLPRQNPAPIREDGDLSSRDQRHQRRRIRPAPDAWESPFPIVTMTEVCVITPAPIMALTPAITSSASRIDNGIEVELAPIADTLAIPAVR